MSDESKRFDGDDVFEDISGDEFEEPAMDDDSDAEDESNYPDDLNSEGGVDADTTLYTGDDDEEDMMESLSKKLSINHKQQTSKYLTLAERTRAIAERANQFLQGAPSAIKTAGLSSIERAERELAEGKMPFIICRPLPGGKFVRIPISQLIDVNQ